MPFDFMRQDNWRAEIIMDGESLGRWNRGEMTFGGENTEIVDPEFGQAPIGGRQTAEPVTVSRPFRRTRDVPVYRRVKPRRNRNESQMLIHLLDDFGQPTTAEPVDTVDGVISEIVLPEGSAASSDSSEIQMTFVPRA